MGGGLSPVEAKACAIGWDWMLGREQLVHDAIRALQPHEVPAVMGVVTTWFDVTIPLHRARQREWLNKVVNPYLRSREMLEIPEDA